MSRATHSRRELPGELRLDAALIERTVTELNELHRTKGLGTARAMGECLLRAFFDDDVGVFRARAKAHLSFRALTQDPSLKVGYTLLYHTVGTVGQLRTLPPEIGERLSFSHHKALLPVRSEAAKLRLARRAVQAGLTVRAFEAEVLAVRDRSRPRDAVRRGRPRLPPLAKALKRLPDPGELGEELGPEELDYFTREEARALLESSEASLERLMGLVQGLLEKVDAA
jgi:hypothetical protein